MKIYTFYSSNQTVIAESESVTAGDTDTSSSAETQEDERDAADNAHTPKSPKPKRTRRMLRLAQALENAKSAAFTWEQNHTATQVEYRNHMEELRREINEHHKINYQYRRQLQASEETADRVRIAKELEIQNQTARIAQLERAIGKIRRDAEERTALQEELAEELQQRILTKTQEIRELQSINNMLSHNDDANL